MTHKELTEKLSRLVVKSVVGAVFIILLTNHVNFSSVEAALLGLGIGMYFVFILK